MTQASLPFWKMHGAGNDFVVAEPPASGPASEEAAWPALASAICDRHTGVGADGLLLVLPSAVGDRRMRIFNADGSEAEMCGNGIRCFVRYLLDRGLVEAPDGRVRVETIPGVLTAEATRDPSGHVARVRVSMGRPAFEPAALGAEVEQPAPVLDLPLAVAPHDGTPEGGATIELPVTLVSMGNPHAVAFLDIPPSEYPLARVGPAVEHHPLFAHRTNVEVVRVLDRDAVEMRVWERGVGETQACGSGACAAVVAARLHGRVDDAVEVRVPGGTLAVGWDGEGEVTLEGPVAHVFSAEWPLDAAG
jgi:diaminopimelate epimerase